MGRSTHLYDGEIDWASVEMAYLVSKQESAAMQWFFVGRPLSTTPQVQPLDPDGYHQLCSGLAHSSSSISREPIILAL